MNSNTISNGVVAILSVTLSGSAAVPITIGNSLGASPAGDAIAVTGTGGTVSVSAANVINSLACSPGTLAPNASSTCTVILSGSAGGSIGLSSSSTNLTVPASLAIPSGSGSGAFLATANAFTADLAATVTATLNGSSKPANLSLTTLPTISSLQCAATTLASNASTTCTVTLSKSTTISSVVPLTNSAPSQLSVPASVSVAANGTSATFTASTGALISDLTATITASLNGSSAAATLSLVAPVTLSALQCAATTLASNASTTCTVTLSKSSTISSVVPLTNSAPSQLSVPASVSVAANGTSATFTASTGALISDLTATITASLNGSSKPITFSLVAPVTLSTLQCAATTLASNASTTCTVTLSKSTAIGSVVPLTNSAPSQLTVPSSVSVAANTTSATFTASTGALISDLTATLTAALNGSSKPITLSLVAPVTLSTLQCAATTLASNASTTCTVTLSKSTTISSAVTLSNSAPSQLTVPSSVSVAANTTSATFTASTGALISDLTATLTASLNGSSKPITLSLVAPVTLSALQCAATTLASNASTTCTVTLSKAAPSGGIAVSLVSSLPSLLTVPGTLAVPASAISATFTASAATITTAQSGVITATLGAAKSTATISLVASAVAKPLSLSCTPTVLTPGSSGTCVILLGTSAPLPTVVKLRPTSPAFTIPAALTIPAGATRANVNFTTTSALSGWVILLATSGSVSQAFTFTVRSPATTSLVSLSCTTRITSGSGGVCDLRLSPSGASEVAAISLTSSSRRLKTPDTLLADPGQTTIRFEVDADPEATEDTAILEARVGESTMRETLAVVSSGPRLLAPSRVAGMPATPVRFRVSATGAATITATGLPPGSVFDANSGDFDWLPVAADLGEHQISFLATDAQGARTVRTVLVYVGTGVPVVTQLRNVAGGAVCSPGAIVSISGWFLSGSDTTFTDRSGRSGSLGDSRVLVNGAYAPILSAATGQVDFLCPVLPARTPLDIAVETPSGQSSFLQTTMEETAPAIFTVDGSTQGQALAMRSNSAELAGLPNFRSRARPAISGEQVSLWATGIECVASPRLWLNLGGQSVAIDSALPLSEMAGVCEIAFRIPADVLGDSVSCTVETLRSDAIISSSNRASLAVRR